MLFLLDFLELKFISLSSVNPAYMSNLAGFRSAEKVYKRFTKTRRHCGRPYVKLQRTLQPSPRVWRNTRQYVLMILLIRVAAPESINQLIPSKPDCGCSPPAGEGAGAAVFPSVWFRTSKPHSMTAVDLSFFQSPTNTLLGCGRSDGMRSDAG